jgi:hypothetical protein
MTASDLLDNINKVIITTRRLLKAFAPVKGKGSNRIAWGDVGSCTLVPEVYFYKPLELG